MSFDAIEKRIGKIEESVNAQLKKFDAERANGIATQARVGAGSDEARLLRTFHAKNLGELLQTNVCGNQFRSVSDETKMQVINLKTAFDISRWMGQIFHRDEADVGDLSTDNARIGHCKSVLTNRYAQRCDLAGIVKAFGSTIVGSGDEWVPTNISANYIEEFELQRKLVSAFKEIPMTSNPFELPVQTGVTQARIIGEGAALSDTSFTTGKVQFNAKKFGELFYLPEELNEDSAPNFLELLRSEIIESQGRALENAVLNGDTTAPHMDSDVTAADSALKAWNGLRKTALAGGFTVDFGGLGTTKVKLDEMRNKGGKYFVDPSRLGWIFGSTGYHQSLAIDEVTTVEKVGPAMATILKGSLGAFRGIPIIVSEFVREDLTAAGIYDGLTTDFTVAHLVNLDRWMFGRRRPLRMKVQQDGRNEFDRWQLVSYQRCDFKPVNPAESSSVLGINILK